MSSKANASGLTPEETKSLATRQPTSEEQAIVGALKDVSSAAPVTMV